MIKRLWLMVVILVLTACQSPTPLPTALIIPTVVTVTPGVTPTQAGTPAPVNTLVGAATATAAPPSDLAITASDGIKLAASFYPPASAAPAPGVLLIHMLGRNRTDWAKLANDLQSRGYAVLALDLRGHGDSAGPIDWAKAPADVRAAWDVLVARPEVDPALCAILGGSIGANLALIVGANNPDVVTVIALSPGVDYQGLKPSGVLSNFGERPIFLVASQDDAYAYESVKQMTTLAPNAETYYFAKAGHGTAMFTDPQLETLVLDWLSQHIGALKG